MTEHVKIYGVQPRIQYTADGTSSTYEFPFVIFKTSDIEVYFADTLQDTSTYSVSGSRNSDGGSVTFGSAPASGTIITIVRNLSIERTSDFQEGGALRADVLNDELDYQIACQQQLADNLNRSMVLPPYAMDSDVKLTLPTPAAGKTLVWNANGTSLENSTIEVNALESTLNGYKTEAQNAASTATSKAGIAASKADIATTKASEAISAVNQLNSMRSNCITSIPQDIKLELDNGTLTLKSGSKYYAPNGAQYQITSDKTATSSSNGTRYVYINLTSSNLVIGPTMVETCSGSTDSLNGTAWHMWFDTTNSVINRYGSDGTTASSTCSLPLAIIKIAGGVITSIEKVFNGAGYIGHHAFVLPDVQALIPNGFNPDGTLKNINYNHTELTIIEMVYSPSNDIYRTLNIYKNGTNDVVWSGFYNGDIDTLDNIPNNSAQYYVKDENKVYTGNTKVQYTGTLLVRYGYNNTSVTKFDIEPVLSLATTNDNFFTGINKVITPANGDNSQQIANTAWVLSNTGSTPRDITELKDGEGSLVNANGLMNLSESWQNFDELIIIASSSSVGEKMTAFRISTYWLDSLLKISGSPVIWSNYNAAYLIIANYTATNPSTTSDLYISGHSYCYLNKIYGINRKSS